MSTMVVPGRLPLVVLTLADACETCETNRRPRMFICAYHEGWWDGWEAAVQSVRSGYPELNRTTDTSDRRPSNGE